MGNMVAWELRMGAIVWLLDMLFLDGTIASAIKRAVSPVGKWLRNLFWRSEPQDVGADPFVVSEYLTRIEKASLEILESRKPIEQIVILWWGLDGLRLNEDGTAEWISRKKPSLVQRNVFYQPCQAIIPPPKYDMCQSTQAQIDALMAQNMQLQVQAWKAEQNRQMINALQSYVVRWPGYYERLTDCCCNQTRDRF